MIACPSCKSAKSWVVDKRNTARGEIRRRRQCDDCGVRYTTFEVVRPPKVTTPEAKARWLKEKLRQAGVSA